MTPLLYFTVSNSVESLQLVVYRRRGTSDQISLGALVQPSYKPSGGEDLGSELALLLLGPWLPLGLGVNDDL